MQTHPNAYFPDWDLRLSKGEHAEQLVAHGLTSDHEYTDYEVKCDDRWAPKSGEVYIEFEQYRQGAWRPSGISLTKADRYCIVLDRSIRSFISVPTNHLRFLVEEARFVGRIKQTKQVNAHDDGKWPPTRGALVHVHDLLGITASKAGRAA
jgi:hypothetical protein